VTQHLFHSWSWVGILLWINLQIKKDFEGGIITDQIILPHWLGWNLPIWRNHIKSNLKIIYTKPLCLQPIESPWGILRRRGVLTTCKRVVGNNSKNLQFTIGEKISNSRLQILWESISKLGKLLFRPYELLLGLSKIPKYL
jgi:hypothetical protein